VLSAADNKEPGYDSGERKSMAVLRSNNNHGRRCLPACDMSFAGNVVENKEEMKSALVGKPAPL
jgi:hypothetical protein